jgi:glycosyltransferase involved in cell wall biosynthesis
MKITFVLPCAGISGGIRVLSIYANELRRRGHEVFVISQPHRPASLRTRLKALFHGEGWSAIRQKKPVSLFDGANVPHRIVERQRPIIDADIPDADVVIATWWETAEWVAGLSPSKGTKVYFVQHHEVFDYLPKARAAATYRLPLMKITISKWLVDIMRNRYGDSHAALVPNSVDMEQFNAPPRNKGQVPTIGFFYSTISWKGARTCLDAISILKRQIPELSIIAFGQDKPSRDLPLPDGAKYFRLPDQNELKHIYGRCDAWLCGSLEEGFGLPVLEAMACRCPVVSTAVGGAIDLIDPGKNGYIVPVGNHVALADGAARILALPDEEWRAISDAAYRAASAYTWSDAATLFEEALQTAVDMNNKAGAYG